jgi:4-hydroxy-tetrahydrodipicolinate synthase
LSKPALGGVIAAAATPITPDFEPDLDRFVRLCRFLLDNGCDGLNICGTTGEATSFSVSQRMAIMHAAAAALPCGRLMVGTGAAAIGDALTLTRHAASLGLPGPCYCLPSTTRASRTMASPAISSRSWRRRRPAPIPLYLYNFPALSGVAYSPGLVRRLVRTFAGRIAGLKDSSGDLGYAAEIAAISPDLKVFPSSEAVLLSARAGEFAGCISASANVNSHFCARVFRAGDTSALATATQIRALVSRRPLIARVKAVLAFLLEDPAFENVLPPLTLLPEHDRTALIRDVAPLLGLAI